jgi:octaheme c-type cytochrome (tetrathionate reductase family)
MKRSLIPMLTILFLCLTVVAGAAKEPPKLPDPPPKTFEDGSPWVAVDQQAALERAKQVPELVADVLMESSIERKLRLGPDAPDLADLKHRYLVLNSPLLKHPDEPFNDLYQPVRFMHAKHADVIGDCTTCHHYRPAAEGASETVKCSACHQEPFNPGLPDRLGLKAAYHQQCMGCHQSEDKGPVDCIDCHGKKVPDHTELVQLPDHPDPMTVTEECLRCHQQQADDMLTSAHWRWQGPSPYTVGGEKRVDMGKATNTINNFCVAVPSNWPRCTSCHAGYGWKDADFDLSDQSRMDCLVCHDTTNTYRKVPTAAGMPYPQLNLKTIAQNVGKPTRKNCGDCHFQGGGGDAVKHGDMNGVLYWPSKNCDVHMGGMDFSCQECHVTRNHKIPGRSLSLPVAEGSRSCQDCHTDQPHKREDTEHQGLLNHHLNNHVQHLDCQTCHSPVYAKCRPTKVWWDWSEAGDKSRKPEKDKYGMPDYSWKKGEFIWKESVKPVYMWYNGNVQRHLIGDTFDPEDELIEITKPVGAIWDQEAKIYPFKPMHGRQMADAEHNHLIVPHLFGPGGYWKTLDWQKSFQDGMDAVDLEYSGDFKWVDTVMYWGLRHETMPAENAIGCAQCHPALNQGQTCDRCHQDDRDVDFEKLSQHGTDFAWMAEQGRDVSELIGQTDWIDFEALGYPGDPIVHGGRFRKLPLGQRQAASD